MNIIITMLIQNLTRTVYRQTEVDLEDGLQRIEWCHSCLKGHMDVQYACKQIVPGDAAAFLWIRPLASLGFKHGNVGRGLARRSDTTLCYVLMGSSISICVCVSLFLVTQESQLNPSPCFDQLGVPDGWGLLQLSYLVHNIIKMFYTGF